MDDQIAAAAKPKNVVDFEALPVDASRGEVGDSSRTTHVPGFLKHKIAYGLTALATGAPFSAFNTYAIFQLQIIGYTIGHEPGGSPGTGCPLTAPACLVPFGSSYINYVSFSNYINAICYAVSGFLILVLSGLGDRLGYQRAQYIILLIIFGALCLPGASLKGIDRSTFNTFAALYVVFNFIGFLAGTWGRVFIPFVMHKAEESGSYNQDDGCETEQGRPEEPTQREKRERSGLSMSIWGNNALSIGQAVVLVITIGVTFVSSTHAGLYVTTASGIFCIVLSLIAWPLLPVPPTVLGEDKTYRYYDPINFFIITPFHTFMDLLNGVRKYPEAFKLLLAFTIYADSALVFGGVTSSLFILNVSRDTRIFTAYGIIQPAAALLAGIIFTLLAPYQRRYRHLSFKNVMIFGIAVQAFVALWCCIGISNSSKIGYKHPWEFYLWTAILAFTQAVVSFVFNVLFAQLFPRGREIEYFGFQTVLSCATIWIPQIVNGPVVQATNIIRLPAVVCLATFLVSTALVWWMDDAKGIRQIEEESSAIPTVR